MRYRVIHCDGCCNVWMIKTPDNDQDPRVCPRCGVKCNVSGDINILFDVTVRYPEEADQKTSAFE